MNLALPTCKQTDLCAKRVSFLSWPSPTCYINILCFEINDHILVKKQNSHKWLFILVKIVPINYLRYTVL